MNTEQPTQWITRKQNLHPSWSEYPQ